MGDAAGIGPEVTVKAASEKEIYDSSDIVVVGDAGTLQSAAKDRLVVKPIRSIAGADFSRGMLNVIDLCGIEDGKFKKGKVQAMCGRAAVRYVEHAALMALRGEVSGIVTAPWCKAAVHMAGFEYAAHTEFLANLCGARHFAMMIAARNMRAIPVTRHIAIKDVPRNLTKKKILDAIRTGHSFLKKYGISSPRLAAASLNPHGGEDGILGKEEKEIIIPALKKARGEGICVEGPFSPDKVFYDTAGGRFDLALAMYHDQALIPVKLLAFRKSINVTLGLPFIRTSPCHGTAFDIAWEDRADPQSMIEAIRFIAESVNKR